MTTPDSPGGTPPSASAPPKAGEIPLEDIDKLLESEDPEFTQQLEEVRAVETDQSVEIEATVVGDEDSLEADEEEKPVTGIKKLKLVLRTKWISFRIALRSRMANAWKDLLVFLKTKPKEYALYAIATSKIAAKKAVVPIQAFRQASPAQRLAALVLIALTLLTGWVLFSNFKGVWIPSLNEPIVTNLEKYAEFAEVYDTKDGGESFYAAFPQERHEFLFRKMKVNLKRTSQNPLPMGAFEVIVLLDSKDTAIEVRDREVEFFDLLQRVFEEETVDDLAVELGKAKLKGKIKRELNQKLTQGWVKDVNFKTFVLKP